MFDTTPIGIPFINTIYFIRCKGQAINAFCVRSMNINESVRYTRSIKSSKIRQLNSSCNVCLSQGSENCRT